MEDVHFPSNVTGSVDEGSVSANKVSPATPIDEAEELTASLPLTQTKAEIAQLTSVLIRLRHQLLQLCVKLA